MSRFLSVVLLLLSPVAAADWVATPQSRVSYVSIKQNSIAENNRFTGVSGRIADDGTVEVAIDLASVDTGVDIRNQRMQSMFFEVARFPQASVRTRLDPVDVAQLDAGAPLERTLTLELSLHGVSVELPAQLRAFKVNDQIYVQSIEPVLLSAADFGLAAGVEALREVAGLEAISTAVPVSVDLRFDAAP